MITFLVCVFLCKVYIGELIEQSFSVRYDYESETGGTHYLDGHTWNIDGNETNPLKSDTIGPFDKNRTYTPLIKITSQLPYTKTDGSMGILHNISNTCFGKSFSSTQWHCADGNGHIPFEQVCDNPHAPNCADGSDEAKLLCTGGDNNFVTVSLVVYFFAGIITISFGKYQF